MKKSLREQKMKFYGRQEEMDSLRWQFQTTQATKVARMAVVTGRRRIGKTTLIQKAFQDIHAPFLYYFVTGMSSEEAMTRSLVAMASERLSIRFPPALSKLADAIGWLLECSKTQPLVLVLDECQALEKKAENFWSELQRVWDLGKSGAQLLLIMSGSIQSAMERIFGSHNEPLFGRADQLMTIRPFNTSLMGQIFEDYRPQGTKKDLLLFYALTEGVARYVELLVDAGALTEKEMLQFLYSERGSWLRAEGQTMLANEFRFSAPVYHEILKELISGRSKRTELQNGIDTDISPYLNRLETLFGLVSRVNPFLEEKNSRLTRYRIKDLYIRFWLTFLCDEESQARMELQQWSALIESTQKALPTYLGRTLEDWFRQRLLESGDWNPVGGWWDRRGENEIDLVALDRLKKRVLFAEVKTNAKKYDELRLRMKSETFLNAHNEFKNWEKMFLGLSPKDMLNDF